jgi:hypothetical protein
MSALPALPKKIIALGEPKNEKLPEHAFSIPGKPVSLFALPNPSRGSYERGEPVSAIGQEPESALGQLLNCPRAQQAK